MNLLRMNFMVIGLLLIGWANISLAQTNNGSTQLSTGATIPYGPTGATVIKNKTEKKQTLNFEDELVEGSAQKPELFYLFQKKNFNYKRLIKLRENFLPEMRRTSEDIQRLRGGR